MIIELLFNLLFGFITMIINFIPTFNFNFSIDGVLSPLFSIFQYLNLFVDVSVLLGIITIAIIRDNFTFIKNILVAIVNKIPFIN